MNFKHFLDEIIIDILQDKSIKREYNSKVGCQKCIHLKYY